MMIKFFDIAIAEEAKEDQVIMDNNKKYHVTIVDNETGKVITDINTKGIMYAALVETERGKRIAEMRGAQEACERVTGRNLEGVKGTEAIALLEGLQDIIKEMMEQYPILQTLMMVYENEDIELGQNCEEECDE